MAGRSLLVTDLDGTLLGDDTALRAFADWYDDHRETLRLVYASGRFYDSVIKSIERTALPRPDAVIGGVGTQVRRFPKNRPIEGVEHKPTCGFDAERILSRMAEISDAIPQPNEFQSKLKVSFFLVDARRSVLDSLQRRMREDGLCVDMIYSSNCDLDVVPAGVNKGSAAKRLATLWGIEPHRVMVSGDSANDMALFGQGFRGIVVGNAHAELKALSGESIYHAGRSHAAGVLEGVKHWLAVHEYEPTRSDV